MTKIKLAVILLIFFLVTASALVFFYRTQGVGARVSARPSSARIGNDIEYTLKVTSPRGVEVEVSDIRPGLKDLEVRKSEDIEKISWLRKTRVLSLYLRSYTPGIHYVPTPEIRYRRGESAPWKSLRAPEARIRIRKTVKEDLSKITHRVSMGGDMAASGSGYRPDGPVRDTSRYIDIPIRYGIRDIRPPRRVLTLMDFALIGAGALGGSALLAFIAALIAGAAGSKGTEADNIPPRVSALRRLEKLKAKDLLRKGKTEEFCSEALSILRDYVRANFSEGEREFTDEELAAALDALEDLTAEQRMMLREHIETYSRVKFSGVGSGDAAKLDPDLNIEFRFIEETGKGTENGIS